MGLKDSVIRGDVVEFVIRVNGTDVNAVKCGVLDDAPVGEETRVMCQFSINDMLAFSKDPKAAPVREIMVTSGELKEEVAKLIEP
jgi:hypothetical protein